MTCGCKHSESGSGGGGYADRGLAIMATSSSSYADIRMAGIGADAPAANAPAANAPATATSKDEPLTPTSFASAVGKITPTLIIVGVATGAAMAIGSGLIQYYVFSKRKH